MNLQEQLKECQKKQSSILATNFYNFETLKGIIAAAKITRQPVILQLTQSSIDYMGLENAIALGRSALKSAGVQGWLHLDHGASFELAERCLKAGIDSVMFDGSELSFEKNIEITRKVVQLAKLYDASVEAELGYVAKIGQSKVKMEYTSPADAKIFVQETGVNSLAIAIGTAHGFYTSEPKLEFERLAEIRKSTDACLVLHGSSGVSDDQLRRAVSLGICKVNLATEIKNIFMQTLKVLMSNSEEIDLRKVFPPATEAVTELVARKLLALTSSKKATRPTDVSA